MRFRDLLRDTVETLWAHKLRTSLTMFGIAWGIVSITLMVAAVEGLRVGQNKQVQNFGKDIMIVFAGRTSMQAGGTRAGKIVRWEDTDPGSVQEEATACQYVIPELGRSAIPVHSLYNNGALLITGSLPPFAEIRCIPVAEGRFYNWEDQVQGRRVAFLGSDVKKQLFGTRAAVGETIHVGDFPYQVVGVMEKKDQNSSYDGFDITKVFIPFSAMIRDFPDKPPFTAHNIDRLLVTPRSLEFHDACKSQVRRALGRIHRFDPSDKEAAHVWDTVENAVRFQQIVNGMKYFLGGIGLATLVLGGIGVMNVMLVAVRERTREIGVRKAVGATSRAVLGQFFAESLIVVLLSGGVGLGVGFGICGLINLIPMPPFFAGMLPTLGSSLATFAVLGTVALLSALYPAHRAASIDPIEALRHEPGS